MNIQEDYILNINDLVKKTDGVSSDSINNSYTKNTMIEFPIINLGNI